MNTILALLLALVLPVSACRAEDLAVTALASLTNPQKLATLKGDRAANDRLLKCVYWLHDARQRGQAPGDIIEGGAEAHEATPPPMLRWCVKGSCRT